jgi:hypothetical protein
VKLTPDILEAAYEYLRATPPFKGWRLPEGDEIGFIVSRRPDRFSHMQGYVRSSQAEISISEKLVGSTCVLIEAMAHEMVHLRQHLRRTETANTEHNAEFYRLAKRVCAVHGWDFKTF